MWQIQAALPISGATIDRFALLDPLAWSQGKMVSVSSQWLCKFAAALYALN
jgi:hypothetical protein